LRTERQNLGAITSIPQVAIVVALAAGLACLYLVATARSRHAPLTRSDILIFVVITAIVTAGGVPLVEGISRRAKAAALLQDLGVLRAQIELYKVQHGGQPPVLYQGTLPQLCHCTDDEGNTGPKGRRHRYGPYLPTGIPPNPFTGTSLVVATDAFPPKKSAGGGGWLYHQPTGGIVPDQAEFLEE